MSNQQPAPQTAQTDLTHTQADEATGRPSGGAVPADGLQTTDQTTPNTDAYKDLKLPENLKACEAKFSAFKKLAAELKLPAEAAQKLVEWETSAAAEGAKNALQRRADILQRWTEQSKEMLGAHYERKLTCALEAAQRFGGEELRALLDITGLGSHPAVVKAFYQISRQMAEDQSVSGRGRGDADKTFAEALYGQAQ